MQGTYYVRVVISFDRWSPIHVEPERNGNTIRIPAGSRRGPRAATERLCRKEEVNMVLSNPFRAPGGRPHIVIPYSYADHGFAQKLVGALRQDQITPWIDEVDMSAGVFLVNRISQAARPVDFVVPAISASSVASSWVQHELRTDMTRNFGGRPARVLPARVDGSTLPDFLASQPYFDFHGGGWSRAYDDLMVAVQKRTSPWSGTGANPAIRRPRRPRARKPLLRRLWGS